MDLCLGKRTAAALFLAATLATATAHAEPAAGVPTTSQSDAAEARDTHRLAVGLLGEIFASFPGSLTDGGPALHAAVPLWLGQRYRFAQWRVDAQVLVGLGTATKNVYVAPGVQAGCEIYLGSVLGLEFLAGAAGIAQLGKRTVGGVGFSGSGGYVFRFWPDDRRRVKLLMTMLSGGYFASDPGNDMGLNASVLGVGLAYEAPY